MPMRLSGLMSGMDTESIVTQLVEAKRVKVDDAKKAQTKLQWTQDAWKALNTKITKLYNGTLSNLRFQSSYMKKVTKVSNGNVASVITGEGAMNSVQSLKVSAMAQSGYLTGAQLGKGEQGEAQSYTTDTQLSELGLEGLEQGSLKLTVGGEEKEISISGSTTIGQLVQSFRDAGINASFDAANQRFYLASKDTGLANDFSLSAGDEAGMEALKKLGLNYTDGDSGAVKNDAVDAEIYLNGVKYTGSRNTFEINGLTLTINATTAENETVTLTTQDDTDGIYDMIKGFLKEYNELINEMDKLYNADSARGYEPLTNEEKEAMSDSEVEEWEKKVKDSLLRRDSTLGTVSTALKQIMMKGVEVNGKQMYLFDFGIETLSYFTAPDNEKNAYHIDGDADDANTAGNADKLRSMIANDPESVIDFFVGLSRNMYSELTDRMARTEYSSSYTVYEDIRMKKEYDDYTSKIKDLENKLADYEDKWYAKFADMETAMAKMQSNASAVTALLGG